MSVADHVAGLVHTVRSRLGFATPPTAPDSPLPYMSGRPSVKPILPVADMPATVAFYRRLGFEVSAYDDGYAWVRHCNWEVWHLIGSDGLDPATNAAAAYFHVDDADAWRSAMARAAGDDTIGDVADMPWGMREFSFTDPSGNLIRVGQNI